MHRKKTGSAPHLQRGDAAEKFARRWLEQKGLRHVMSNFRCKSGELDLIMRDQDCLVVVEVRYRATAHFGGPLASVTVAKRRRIILATQYFLLRHKALAQLPLRFDVLAFCGPPEAVNIDWRKRAFESDNDDPNRGRSGNSG